MGRARSRALDRPGIPPLPTPSAGMPRAAHSNHLQAELETQRNQMGNAGSQLAGAFGESKRLVDPRPRRGTSE